MFNFLKGVSDQEIVDFAENFSLMLKSGTGVSQTLKQLSEQAQSSRLKEVIKDLEEEMRAGTPLSEAFSKYEDLFGGVFVGLIKAGEESGSLAETIQFAADWKKRNLDLQKEISNATLYPKFLVVAALVVGGGVSLYVLPKIIPVFEQMGVELPLTTRILIGFTDFLQQFWWVVLLGLIGVFILYQWLKHLPKVKNFFDRIFLKLPVFGSFFQNFQLALFAHVLSVLLQSGLSLKRSLQVSSNSVTNSVYKDSLKKIRDQVIQGTPLAGALETQADLYPQNFINIIATGEESGELTTTLDYLAQYYSDRIEETAKRLPTILEPVILILIALFVAFIAISIIGPIYQVTRGFR